VSLVNRSVRGISDASLDRMSAAAQRYAPKAKPRMATNAIEDKLELLLRDIREEEASNALENLVQEATIYLPKRRAELEALAPPGSYQHLVSTYGPTKAAVEAEVYLYKLGRLQGDVPMPIMRDGGNLRVHTQYRTDGITGQEVVVPVMNPNSPEQVLSTQMGVRPADVDQADEVISKRALQLMGYKVDMPQNNKQADFQVTDAQGNQYAFDGMQISQGTPIEMQTHSFVAPYRNGGGIMSVNETQALLDKGYQQGQNVIDQVDHLADRGQVLYPDTARKAGKVLRGDRTQYRVDEELEYDALIMPEYKESIRSGPRHLQPRNIVTAPQGIVLADMPLAYDAVRSGMAGKPEVVPNYGGNNNRYGSRSQKDWHKVNVPMDRNTAVDGQRVFVDAVQANPLVAQLLDQQTMTTLMVK